MGGWFCAHCRPKRKGARECVRKRSSGYHRQVSPARKIGNSRNNAGHTSRHEDFLRSELKVPPTVLNPPLEWSDDERAQFHAKGKTDRCMTHVVQRDQRHANNHGYERRIPALVSKGNSLNIKQ